MMQAKTMPTKLKRAMRQLRWYLFALLVIGFVSIVFKLLHIEINTTASMPIGLYMPAKSQTLKAGDIVSVCLPDAIAKVGINAGYLKSGNCPNGSEHLIKKLIAMPGDAVQLTNQTIIVNGHQYLAPIQTKNNLGKLVKRWTKPESQFITNRYWLYGSNDKKHSWDSRYYGGVFRNNISNAQRPILTI